MVVELSYGMAGKVSYVFLRWVKFCCGEAGEFRWAWVCFVLRWGEERYIEVSYV